MSNQPQISSVGVLDYLSVAGMVIASSGISVAGNKITNLADPVAATDGANRAYVDSRIQYAAGPGLLATLVSGKVLLTVSVDNFSIQIVNNALRLHPNVIGYGLSYDGTSQLSVNKNQPNIVSVGTLDNLSVAGVTRILDTTDSSGTDTGSLRTSGGFSAAKSGYISGSLFVGNGLNVNAKLITNVASPVNSTDAANRAFVESIITTPGAGIVKSNTTVSANVDNMSLQISGQNQIRISSGALGTGLTGGSGSVIEVIPNQPQIVQVGTLNDLTVSGNVFLNSTENSVDASSGALRLVGGMYIGKDSTVHGKSTIDSTLTANGTVRFTLSDDANGLNTGSFIVSGGASISRSLHVGSILNMNSNKIVNVATPTLATDGVNKSYVDSLIVTAGAGLVKSGTVISAVVDGTSIEIAGNTMRVASSFVGTGLTGGSGVLLSVNKDLPHVTSVGLLSSLAVNGAVTAYSGLNVNNARITSLGTPLNATDAVNRAFVDSTRPTPGAGLVAGSGTNLDVNVDGTSVEVAPNNTVRVASGALGAGLTGGSGAAISVIPNQPQIVTVGTLTNLAVDGAVSFKNTTDATSATSGPVKLSGGISIAKSAHIGGTVNALSDLSVLGLSSFINSSVFSSHVTLLSTDDAINSSSGALVIAGGLATGKGIYTTDGVRFPYNYDIASSSSGNFTPGHVFAIRHEDATVADVALSTYNSIATTAYNNRLRLWSRGSEKSADGEYVELASTPDNVVLRAGTSGTGSMRSLVLNNQLSIDASGIVRILSTQNSSSPSTGSLVLPNGNGLGVTGNVHVGGTLYATNGIDASNQKIINLATPTNPYDAVNLEYVNSVAQGLSVKKSVYAASTGPVTLTTVTAGSTLDGVVLSAGDRVLLKNQTSGVENGIYTITNAAPVRSTDLATGANAMSAFVFVESGTVNAGSGWVNTTPGTTDIVGTDVLNFSQFSGAGQITAGFGMSKDGNILNVNVDGTSLENFNDILRISSGAIGTGLSGGSGTTISVNGDLPHVYGLGTITSGVWNGSTVAVAHGGTGNTSFGVGNILFGNNVDPVSSTPDFNYSSARLTVPNIILTSMTESNSFGTGALVVKGGAGISGNLRVEGNTYFTGTVTVPDPVNSSDATSLGYVQSIISTPGTGLSKAGTVFSVNATLPHVTAVGTLTGLTSSGSVVITNSTDSSSTTSGSLTTIGGVGIGGSIYVAGDLDVTRSANFRGTVTVPNPVQAGQASNKFYVDSLISTAGVGLSKSANVFSVNSNLSHVTQVGTLVNLAVTGSVRIDSTTDTNSSNTGALSIAGGLGLGGSLYVNGNIISNNSISSSGILNISNNTQSTSVISGSITTSGGIGVSGNANIAGIMKISNATQSTSATTGALVVQGGLGIGGNLTCAGSVIIPDPTTAFGAATKGYVDRNLTTAGVGLSKTDTTMSVNSTLTHVTRIGTQTQFDVSGVSNFTNTTQSNSSSTGALIISGGIGLSGNIFSTGNIETSGILNISNSGNNAVTVTGGAIISGPTTINGLLTVTNDTVFSTRVTVPTPINPTDAVTRAYTDAMSYLSVGAGITKSGATLSLNASQPTITQVGTLTSLTISGVTRITDTTATTDVNTGALVVSGGIATPSSVAVGTNLSVTGTSAFTGAVTVPTPTATGHAVNKSYTDGLTYLTAGTGLTKTGATISVNASQTQITAVGTLTSLTSSGAVNITNATASTSSATGALRVTGGVGIGGALFVGSTLSVTGTSTFTGAVTVTTTPTAANHAVNKSYTDGLTYLTVNSGLTLASGTLSINSSQPGITSVGTLTGLTSSGIVTVTNANAATTATSGAVVVSGGIGVSGASVFASTVTIPTAPTDGSHAVNRDYVNNLTYLAAGTGISKTGNTLATTPSQTHVTSVGTLTSLSVNGAATFTGTVSVPTPVNPTDAANRAFVETMVQGLSIKSSVTAATTGPVLLTAVVSGYTMDGVVLAIGNRVLVKDQTSATENGIYIVGSTGPPARSVDLPVNANAAGAFTFVQSGTVNGSSGWVVSNSSTSATVGINGITWSQFSAAGQITAGDGMVKSGNTLTVLTDGTSLEIVNDALRISSGAIGTGLSGGSGIPISINANQPGITSLGTLTGLNVSGATTLNTLSATGKVTISTSPIDATDAVNKGYTDGLTYLSAGTGLTKTGNTLSINASQPTITQVGTLTSITSSGIVNITDATASSSTTTGALRVTGGAGFGGSINVGGTLAVTGASTFTGAVTVPTPTATGHAVTKSYTDGLTYLTAGTGLTKTGATISVNASQTQITQVGTLTSLTSSGIVNITNATPSTSSTTGAITVSGGAGITGAVFIGSTLNVTGQVTVPTPIAATSAVTKAYTDGLSYLLAGTGLTKTGNTLSVNTSQPGITSVGVLTGMTSSGVVSITDATQSTSTSSGSIITAGGLGVADAINVGNYVNSPSFVTGNFTRTTHVNSTTLMNTYRFRNGDFTNTNSTLSVGSTATSSNYTSRFTLFTLNTTETSANTEQLMMEATSTGGTLKWGTAGTGVNRPFSIYTNTVFNTDGTISQLATTDASSTTTGSISVAGGLGVAKSIFLGSSLYMSSMNLRLTTATATNGFGMTLRNENASTPDMILSIANSVSAASYKTEERLYTIGTTATANSEYLSIASTSAGGNISWGTSGTGAARPLSIYGGAMTVAAGGTAVTIGSGTSFVISSGADSTTTTTGALVLTGGLGVGKNLTANSATIGNVSITPFQTTAGWINMPTTGPSGIGTGGAGSNCWIGYAQSAGHWFTNAAPGDVCYRNANGKILWGTTAGTAGMALVNDNLGLGTITPGSKLDVVGNINATTITVTDTTDAVAPNTGSIRTQGGIYAAKTVQGRDIEVTGNSPGTVTFTAPNVPAPYTLTLPPSLPTVNGQRFSVDTNGLMSFDTPVINAFYSGPGELNNIRIWYARTTSTSGACTVYPTTTDTSAGTALFSNILFAVASATRNTTTPNQVVLTGVRSISTDRKTVIFNVIMGNTIQASGNSTTLVAPNGTVVDVMVWGVP